MGTMTTLMGATSGGRTIPLSSPWMAITAASSLSLIP